MDCCALEEQFPLPRCLIIDTILSDGYGIYRNVPDVDLPAFRAFRRYSISEVPSKQLHCHVKMCRTLDWELCRR